MKPGRFRSLAAALVAGNGAPRTRESIAAEVEAALESAYKDGRADAYPEARDRAMREVSAALGAASQSLANRVVEIERDLKASP